MVREPISSQPATELHKTIQYDVAFKGTVPKVIRFSSFFKLCLKIVMVSGTMSENFRSLR